MRRNNCNNASIYIFKIFHIWINIIQNKEEIPKVMMSINQHQIKLKFLILLSEDYLQIPNLMCDPYCLIDLLLHLLVYCLNHYY